MRRIGTSGWVYASWRGVFYPPGLRQREELEYLSRQMTSVEINGSFYSLQKPESYRRWHDATPEDFVFAVKGGRFVTHMKKLRGGDAPLANFFASGVLCLGRKLGPILWQLPERLRYEPEVLEEFLTSLPRSTLDAQALAERHDERLEGRAWTRALHEAPLRYALEIRHESFLTPEFVTQLRRHGVALVVADAAGRFPLVEDVTADFVYVRLHGSRALYSSDYEPHELADWADRVRAWESGGEPDDARRITPDSVPRVPRDVYVYFDNDVNAYAPRNTVDFLRLLDG